MNAIKSDEYGRADIDYDQCVSCGMCLVSCPFSAIVDKSQIYQTVLALKSETPVYAAIAPSFVRQFGADVTPEMVKNNHLWLQVVVLHGQLWLRRLCLNMPIIFQCHLHLWFLLQE